MTELHLPLIELSILIPLLGGVWLGRLQNGELARRWSLVIAGATLLCTTATWLDFESLHAIQADDRWHLLARLFGQELLVLDRFSAPLLPLTALIYFLTSLTTLRTKIRRFSFAWALVSQALLLATFSCQKPWLIIALLGVSAGPPLLELRSRCKPGRMFAYYMALFLVLMTVGQGLMVVGNGEGFLHHLGIVLLLAGILVRSGIFPFHSWVPELFEHATFGTSLLFVVPIVGAYAAIRLVLPFATESILHSAGLLGLFTALYAAGLGLVQTDVRRLFSFFLLSHSALVFVGLASINSISLTGALCVWLSASLSLAGLGLTLRAVESRCGRVSLDTYRGLYEHTPTLASFFVLTGLASVGFPGTFGFVGGELLVDGAVAAYPHIGATVVIAAALNGIALVRAYFLLFTGTHYVSSVSLNIRLSERYAVLTLAALILIGGLYPQPNILARYQASEELIEGRRQHHLSTAPENGWDELELESGLHDGLKPHEIDLREQHQKSSEAAVPPQE